MKRFAHFFIGNEFSDVVAEIGKLTLKYGGNNIVSSVNFFLIDNTKDAAISIRKLECSSIATLGALAGFDKNIEIVWDEESLLEISNPKALSDFYAKKVFDKILTINTRGKNDVLYVFLHFPLYKPEALETAKLLYSAIESAGKSTEIDFVGYCDDLVDIIERNFKISHPSCEQIAVFTKFKEDKKMSFKRHFIVLQNTSQNGITLSLTLKSLSDVIGRFTMLCAEYYDEIFPNTVDYKDIVSFGLSTLHFDKYLFTEYLLGRTILNAMDNSEVNRKDVDVNIACDTANLLLKGKSSILSEFFMQFTENDIEDIRIIQQRFEEEINQIIEKCRKTFLENKSITTKAAILAAILSKTECELFSKSIFNQNADSINDLFSEPIDYFVKHNNKVEYYQIEGQSIVNPIKELKELNTKLINSESEIRDLQQQLSSLEKQISDAQKVEDCYIEDGFFHFHNKKFRLLSNFKEDPLEETYKAHPVNTPSIDLRENFNIIKNQGEQGSCLAFSITSIFEYILKLNHSKEVDLSEAFLYYNARNLDTAADISVNTDTGSRFLPAMQSLQQFGISLEKFCPYNDSIYDQKPSEEAYQDAANRKLLKALNVNRTIDDIKSALADGYPIAISLNLCSGFKNMTSGFIPTPSETEIAELMSDDNINKDKNSKHTMVITGFSDELQMFVLRNSWGAEWGDNGYCYVPYSYIGNEQLCDFSCIITEVESLSAKMEHIPALKVDDTDLNIRYFITKVSMAKEIAEVENNKKQRDYLRLYFEKIKKILSSPNDRDAFITKSEEKLREEQEELKKNKKVKQNEQEVELERFNQYKKLTIIKTVAYIVELTFLFILCNYQIKYVACLFSNNCVINWWFVISAAVIIGGILYFRKKLPKTVMFSIGAILLFFGLSLLITFIRGNTEYTVSYLWLVPIYTALIGFIYYKSNKRWKEWRNKRDVLEEEIRQINKKIAAKESEITSFKIKTFTTWILLKSLEKIQTHFQLLYGNFISLINNLRSWYREVADSKENIELVATTPNNSLLNKEILDMFFENKLKNNEAFEIDLSRGIEDYVITENYLKTYKEQLFDKIAENLITYPALSDFDISAHVVDNRFSEIAKEVTRNLIDDIDDKSDLFLCVSSSERGEIIRSTGIYAPSLNLYRENLRKKLGKYSEPYFESTDKYRIVFIKTATLWFKESVVLKSE